MTLGRTIHMTVSTPVGTHLLPHLILLMALVVVGPLVVVGALVVGSGGVVTGESGREEQTDQTIDYSFS